VGVSVLEAVHATVLVAGDDVTKVVNALKANSQSKRAAWYCRRLVDIQPRVTSQ
jgi:hypothetical protein